MYNYSIANNIEVGVRCEYAMTGIVGKAFNVTGDLVSKGVDKVNHDVLGMSKDVNPIEKFKTIFENSELIYKTQPNIIDKSGLGGLIGQKKLNGFNIVIDNFELPISAIPSTNKVTSDSKNSDSNPTDKVKLLSVSQLAKNHNISSKEITSFLQQKGLIDGDKITPIGISKGLVLKSYMGNDYIAYPENLQEWNELK